MTKERFRIWITVEIFERDFNGLKDAQNQCEIFFNEFSNRHLNGETFEALSIGSDHVKNSRDITFAKYFEGVDEAEKLLSILRKAANCYKELIVIPGYKAFIEKSYFENKLKSLEHDIIAYNLLKNF